MPFIGNQPALSYTSFAKQDFTTSATTSYTLDNPVTNENELALFINFVRQEPTTAYTASGTTLTLTSATSASDDMYCVFLGKAVQTVNPPAGSVGTAQLASGVLPTNTPAFFVKKTDSTQTLTNGVWSKVEFNSVTFDTNSNWDAVNYRFTPTVAGKYYFYGKATMTTSTASSVSYYLSAIYKNGSTFTQSQKDFRSNTAGYTNTEFVNAVIDMNGTSDYVELFANLGAGGTLNITGGSGFTIFSGYKIIE